MAVAKRVFVAVLLLQLTFPHLACAFCPLILPPSAYFPSVAYNYSSPVTANVSAALETTVASFLAANAGLVQEHAVAVVHEGRTIFTSGLTTTAFRIGSITKIFTALGALILREKGLLSLDDPVKKFLPNFSIINPYEPHDITLRELMGHVSGLPRELCANFWFPPGQNSTNGCPVDESKVLESVAKMQLILPPWGRQAAYSNLGFALLGHSWEKATSPPKSWEQFILEDVVAPLGMNNTGVDLTNVELAGITPGVRDSLGWVQPAGQMYSTAADLAKFLVFLLDLSPPLISGASLREWTRSSTIFADGQGGFGLPWELVPVNFSRELLITKGGAVFEHISVIAIHPPTRLGVVVLTVTNGTDPTPLATQILDVLVPVVEASNEEIIEAHYAGLYICETTPPIFSPSFNATLQVVGGFINVTGSPSLGLSALINITLLFDGQALVQDGSFELLLKNATENSFFFDPAVTCEGFFLQISYLPSSTDPNYPGTVYFQELVFDLPKKTVEWPFEGAVCTRQ